MDYEKKYKDALEQAKKELRTCGSMDCDAAKQIFRFFPELADSEDERIRKAILDYLTKMWGNSQDDVCGVHVEDAIAWLEKQGDKDKLIKELGEYKAKYTQEVLEKHLNNMSNKDNERLRKTTISFLKEFADKGYENAVECIDWLEKQGEQKVSYTTIVETGNGGINALVTREITNGCDDEQKPFDYENANIQQKDFAPKVEPKFKVGDSIKTANEEPLTITEITDNGYWSEDLFICNFDDAAKWELAEQKPAWSEEDEKEVAILEAYIRGKDWSDRHIDRALGIVDELVNKVKSLKDRYTWKPSEEQMEIIDMLLTNETMDDNVARVLRELKEQLKK